MTCNTELLYWRTNKAWYEEDSQGKYIYRVKANAPERAKKSFEMWEKYQNIAMPHKMFNLIITLFQFTPSTPSVWMAWIEIIVYIFLFFSIYYILAQNVVYYNVFDLSFKIYLICIIFI